MSAYAFCDGEIDYPERRPGQAEYFLDGRFIGISREGAPNTPCITPCGPSPA